MRRFIHAVIRPTIEFHMTGSVKDLIKCCKFQQKLPSMGFNSVKAFLPYKLHYPTNYIKNILYFVYLQKRESIFRGFGPRYGRMARRR